MRLFIGIEIPDQLKKKISEIQDKFKDFSIKFVETKNLHFCLRFLCEVDESKVDSIKEVIDKIGLNPFSIHIKGLGVFPDMDYIRVVWLGVEDSKDLVNLVNSINQGVEDLGFNKSKPFVPHLTLGRVKSGKDKDKLKTLIEDLKNIDIGEMQVNQIHLIKSELTPNGPIYKKIHSKTFTSS